MASQKLAIYQNLCTSPIWVTQRQVQSAFFEMFEKSERSVLSTPASKSGFSILKRTVFQWVMLVSQRFCLWRKNQLSRIWRIRSVYLPRTVIRRISQRLFNQVWLELAYILVAMRTPRLLFEHGKPAHKLIFTSIWFWNQKSDATVCIQSPHFAAYNSEAKAHKSFRNPGYFLRIL
jgi:hypothetical protein